MLGGPGETSCAPAVITLCYSSHCELENKPNYSQFHWDRQAFKMAHMAQKASVKNSKVKFVYVCV